VLTDIYNALTIHAIAHLHQNGKPTSVLKECDGKFWTKMAYQIDKFTFSLDEIEHGILRGY
jgi:hypothetical protein